MAPYPRIYTPDPIAPTIVALLAVRPSAADRLRAALVEVAVEEGADREACEQAVDGLLGVLRAMLRCV